MLLSKKSKISREICHYSLPLSFAKIKNKLLANLFQFLLGQQQIALIYNTKSLRPYHDEYTRSRLITEVKHRRARIVLGWVTAWELLVP